MQCTKFTDDCSTKHVFGVIISYDSVVDKRLLDFLEALTVFSPVTGSSCIFIIYCSFTGVDLDLRR